MNLGCFKYFRRSGSPVVCSVAFIVLLLAAPGAAARNRVLQSIPVEHQLANLCIHRPPNPENGKFSSTCFFKRNGDTCKARCSKGYTGQPAIRCVDGTWSIPTGDCISKMAGTATCAGKPVRPANGTFPDSCIGTAGGQRCVGHCRRGYSGPLEAICGQNNPGEWGPIKGSCSKVIDGSEASPSPAVPVGSSPTPGKRYYKNDCMECDASYISKTIHQACVVEGQMIVGLDFACEAYYSPYISYSGTPKDVIDALGMVDCSVATKLAKTSKELEISILDGDNSCEALHFTVSLGNMTADGT